MSAKCPPNSTVFSRKNNEPKIGVLQTYRCLAKTIIRSRNNNLEVVVRNEFFTEVLPWSVDTTGRNRKCLFCLNFRFAPWTPDAVIENIFLAWIFVLVKKSWYMLWFVQETETQIIVKLTFFVKLAHFYNMSFQRVTNICKEIPCFFRCKWEKQLQVGYHHLTVSS